jgi:hypothetical protein
MISDENKKIITEMQAAAWKKVASQASVVEASTPGTSKEYAIKYLIDLFNEEKRKIDRATDRMPDVRK